MSDTVVVWITSVTLLAIAAVLIAVMVRSILKEPHQGQRRRIWSTFGLSIAFCGLFLISWAAQAVAEWGTYRAEQREHAQPVSAQGFMVEFGQSTLENWQSEFLQLFSFVVFSAVLIHKGSAESKDSDDRMEETLRRIERRLDALGVPTTPSRLP
jgi:branched-subunit amino acid ABC-type transport system permease component